jgi:hypothetical protein
MPSGEDYPQAAQVAHVRNAQVKHGDTCKRGTSDLHLFWMIFDGETLYSRGSPMRAAKTQSPFA